MQSLPRRLTDKTAFHYQAASNLCITADWSSLQQGKTAKQKLEHNIVIFIILITEY